MSKTSANLVINELRSAILDGTLKPGEHIVQEEWAKRLNVSRIPVREALSKLESEGLVSIVPHKGAIVRALTVEDLEELYCIRSYLESKVILKALPNMTMEDKEKIKETFEAMLEAVNTDQHDRYAELHEIFHYQLREKTTWKRGERIVAQLATASMAPDLLIKQRFSIQDEHRRIIEAIFISDPEELQAAIEYHVHRTKNNVINYLKTRNGG
ncbi:GntR family transcriptional regulator [Lysinibacillus fusiformis]|nr:GntR family transcriptional regulator [Lysinibacillus fusiformis]